jgi:hypothetical protein
MSRLGRFSLTSIVALALVVALAPAIAGGYLGIIEDPDPIGNAVAVTVQNASPEARKGVVTVHATVGGKTARSSATVVVAGGTTTTVTVTFGSTVQDVVDAGIIEDPDPIPL